jgi:hypothetical protein
LTTVFDEAWAKIEAANSPLCRDANVAAARVLLAKWVIAKGHAGERDANKFVEDAVVFMAGLELPLPSPTPDR